MLLIGCRNGRAVGVVYSWNQTVLPDADKETHIVRVRKLVVLSAGAIGTPLVLERSGIGAEAVLHKHGIKQVADLPGVGENYRGKSLTSQEKVIVERWNLDHKLLEGPYIAAPEVETQDGFGTSRGDVTKLAPTSPHP